MKTAHFILGRIIYPVKTMVQLYLRKIDRLWCAGEDFIRSRHSLCLEVLALLGHFLVESVVLPLIKMRLENRDF